MRILWVGDPPLAPTGYGGQAALFIPRLRRAGHDVALLAVGGSAGAIYRTPDGVVVYPTIADPRGNDCVVSHAKDYAADLVLTLGDPHACDREVYKDLPWLAWAPLDFETPTRATLRSLRAARWVWSPSRHGYEAYCRAGMAASIAHVPHGVDSKVFDLGDRGAARRALAAAVNGFDLDAFLVVSVAANKGTPSRKGFFETLAAFKAFADGYPSQDRHLYLHTDPLGIANGEDLRAIMDLVGLAPELVSFPPQYRYLTGQIKPEHLAGIYCAADVYLSTSHGEGFGLGAIEAQMCGTPVTVPNNTAQIEAMHAGRRVAAVPYMPFDGATLWGRPVIGDVVEALEASRKTSWNRPAIRDCVLHYDADRVFKEKMLPALAEIERML